MRRYSLWTPLLENWFEKPACDLPKELYPRVERELNLHWDSLSSDERRSVAKNWDSQHDPASEELQRYWFECLIRIDELEEEIEKWKAVDCPTAKDLKLQKKELAALTKKRTDLVKELGQSQELGFRTGHRNTDLQYNANELAKHWKEENKRGSTRNRVGNF